MKENDDKIKNDKAIIKDFTHTTSAGQAKNEIFKFIEAAGLSLTVRQLVILNGLLKHYKNLSNSKTNFQLMKARDEVYALEIKLGLKAPNSHNPTQ
jgi:hypothetical protein